ncbi:hypothetical protein AMTRI_Chr01g126590 [Amborella trichopoda]|uniref:EF-hand domain-containing protein n=1 Tax=Amborella trichopoda TaxID=13333 RepID=W1NNJ5_AMBTC|nr:probable calcium-binding protein CML30 [Amborella trichopoda]ERM97253.1 hypothetical protein AMTR_s00119p00101870 [Amborella trichopoda]|eukprot:XP_020517629.1 probable calcium-binding protein CML30 [Amborella trichopoda]
MVSIYVSLCDIDGFFCMYQVINWIIEFQQTCMRIRCRLRAWVGSLAHPREQEDTHPWLTAGEERESNTSNLEHCTSCNMDRKVSISNAHDIYSEVELTIDDVKMVTEILGLGIGRDEREGHSEKTCDCELLSDIAVMLEEKEASVEELKEVFHVFDEDRDGFIDAADLQRVMGILRLREAMDLAQCHKMIRAFDENRDGRIDYEEFKIMMENNLT